MRKIRTKWIFNPAFCSIHLPYCCHWNKSPPNSFRPTFRQTRWKLIGILVLFLQIWNKCLICCWYYMRMYLVRLRIYPKLFPRVFSPRTPSGESPGTRLIFPLAKTIKFFFFAIFSFWFVFQVVQFLLIFHYNLLSFYSIFFHFPFFSFLFFYMLMWSALYWVGGSRNNWTAWICCLFK